MFCAIGVEYFARTIQNIIAELAKPTSAMMNPWMIDHAIWMTHN
jgi:hypothetical protein